MGALLFFGYPFLVLYKVLTATSTMGSFLVSLGLAIISAVVMANLNATNEGALVFSLAAYLFGLANMLELVGYGYDREKNSFNYFATHLATALMIVALIFILF